VIVVVLVALAASLAGIVLERRLGPRAAPLTDRLVRLILWVLGPIVTFPSVAHLHVNASVGAGLAAGWIVLAAILGLGWVIGRRVLRADRPTAGGMAVSAASANTGYLGIPLVAAVLGPQALGPAIAWDAAVTTPWTMLVGFAVGASVGTKAGESPRDRLRAFLTRNPVLVAAIAGLLAPEALAPGWLVDVSHVAAYALLPVGFLVLGVLLTAESEDVEDVAPLPRQVAIVFVLRLVVAPLLFALLVLPLHGIPDAYRLQSVMPCAIMSLVIAHTFGLHPRLAAAAIASTTAAVVVGFAVGRLVLG
jgi:predicted permease